MPWHVVLSLVLVLGACADRSQRVGRRTTPSVVHRDQAPPVGLLVAAVRATTTATDDASHVHLVAALRQVAAQIAALPAPLEAAKIEVAADRLAASPAAADTHVELVQRALRSSQRALEKTVGPKAAARTIESLTAADAALSALDPARPLRDQQAPVIAALESLTNTVALHRGTAPPFPEATRTWPTPSPEVALANARTHALAMAAADFPHAGAAAGRVIEDLAAFAASLGPVATRQVTQLRFQAQRLRGQRAGILDEARWIGSALATALDALEAARGASSQAARDAVDNINEARSLAFQRAAIQDAVRATIAALALPSACPATTTARAE